MYIGIDFGTSFSQASCFHDGKSQIILEHMEYGIPSVFCYDGSCEVFGQEALDLTENDDSLELLRNFKMDAFDSLECDGVKFSTRDIIRDMYRYIIDDAEHRLSEEYDVSEYQGVVLSMPVCFGDSERKLFRDAVDSIGREGTNVVGIIKEPVAAALAYYEKIKTIDGNIMVFDLGGGTCDVAIVEKRNDILQQYEVIASCGIPRGGRDFDKRLIDYFYWKIREECNYDMSLNASDRNKVYEASISIKHKLSRKDEVEEDISVDGKTFPLMINNNTFFELSLDLLDEIKELVLNMKHFIHSFKTVICVGGGSRMRIVQELLHESFSDCRILLYNPEHAIAIGNSIFAKLLEEKGDAPLPVVDKTVFSFGVRKSCDGKDWIYNVIMKGDEYPCRKEIRYRVDGSGYILFEIYQNECQDKKISVAGYKPIGRLPFRYSIHNSKFVTLFFELDEKGLLQIRIKDEIGNYTYYDFETVL